MVARFTNIEPKNSVLLGNNRLRMLTKNRNLNKIPVFSSWLFNSLLKVTSFNIFMPTSS